MVIKPTSVISPIVSCCKCPRLLPSAARINENSLIWATVSPARKPVRLRYPIAPMMIMTIIGLPISTNSENTTDAPICPPSMPRSSAAPSSMKKNSSKKSLKLTSLAAICSRNAVEAIDTPARKAPTSLLNPSTSPATAPSTAQAMANSINSSDEWARRCSSAGST